MQERAPQREAVTVTFTLNGQPTTVDAAPFASLADTLRHELGFTGTKIGCEAGDCGACTVIVDGAQACACLVATAQAEGAVIHTVEGVGPRGLTERLRRAFLEHGAAQCGICTPGMMMAAADLLTRAPTPSRQQVADGIGGVLCRCTGYLKIVDAVMDVAGGVPAEGSAEVPAGCAVGARLHRVDGWPKVAGTDRFGADEAPADALWMRVVRSPHARARFTLGDLAAVRARTPGLVAILTARRRAGRELVRRLPQHQGSAGAGARPRALPRRGGAGAGRHAGGRRRPLGRRPANRLDAGTTRVVDRRCAGVGDASDPRQRAR